MPTIFKETGLGNHKVLESFLIILDGRQRTPIIHIASMEVSNRQLKIKAWLLPEMASTIKDGPSILVLIVNIQNKESFMLRGHCMDIKDAAMMNGIAPGQKQSHFPQIQWELTIEIEELKDLRV